MVMLIVMMILNIILLSLSLVLPLLSVLFLYYCYHPPNFRINNKHVYCPFFFFFYNIYHYWSSLLILTIVTWKQTFSLKKEINAVYMTITFQSAFKLKQNIPKHYVTYYTFLPFINLYTR